MFEVNKDSPFKTGMEVLDSFTHPSNLSTSTYLLSSSISFLTPAALYIPTTTSQTSASSVVVLQTYLSRFGYLPASDMETGALRSAEELQRAVQRLQKFAGIPVTGKFDEATRELLHKPR
jgi:peptidoglycan hydrolase-like protein with peptidoglycan-binding domain